MSSMRRLLIARHEVWPIRGVFNISRGAKTTADVVVVEIRDGDHVGRGECVPYRRYGETIEGALAEIEAAAGMVADGIGRAELLAAMPAGAARSAVDLALWDLEAKRAGVPVWELAGTEPPGPVVSAITISLGSVEEMGRAARAAADCPVLKLKLTGEGDLERVAAVRESAPRSRLIVDANEGWNRDQLDRFAPELARLGVEMIEQPLPAGQDDDLLGYNGPVTLCADESCHDSSTLDSLRGRYGMVNIKLDKTGGLTEALRLRTEARAAGFQVMVGCMVATSLAMAPAVLVAQGAEVVDLDGPLLLARDRDPGLRFDGTTVYPPEPTLWG